MQIRYFTIRKWKASGLLTALALSIGFIPLTAMAGAYTNNNTEKTAPRWSNDRHHEKGLIVGQGCVALPPGASAEYVPGRDAWGRTIIPAEQPRGNYNNSALDLELDIALKNKHIGGNHIDLTADALPLIEQVWQLRDCHPLQK